MSKESEESEESEIWQFNEKKVRQNSQSDSPTGTNGTKTCNENLQRNNLIVRKNGKQNNHP